MMSNAENSDSQNLSRRRFVRSCAVGCAVAGGPRYWQSLAAQELAAQQMSGPVDCSPPPSFARLAGNAGPSTPRLPMPSAPLRPAKKKEPPPPPPLVGKMAMGPIKFTSRDGKQVPYRDWMTDPNDLKSLLRWTSQTLGIDYRSVETDFEGFSYDPRDLPAVLFSGHNYFSLDNQTREKLRRYVLDGGMIIGDACCGWKDFDESFRKEMELIFPQRPLRKLTPDNPIFAAYYPLGDLTYQKADGTLYADGSCIEGITIGCRTGVLYSPIDLTCGWDGHDHPRGLRVVIKDAKKIGANYITYLLGSFQLGQFLSTTKVYHEEAEPTRDDFVMAQLIHEGDWDPDPSAIHDLLRYTRDNSTLEVKFKRVNIKLSDPRAADYPLLYMTGHHEFAWTDEEATRLQRYLKAGGMLVADACCGRQAFDQAFRRQIVKAMPDQPLEMIPPDHPIYSIHEDIQSVEYTPRTRQDFGNNTKPTLEGVILDGRLAVVYSKFDLGNGWERFAHPYAYGYSQEDALKIGANLLVYAVTH